MLTPTKKLAKAVLMRALLDATHERPSTERQEARDFLLHNDPDGSRLELWCSLYGVDRTAVIHGARRLAANGWKRPEAPAPEEEAHDDGL